MNNFYFTVYVDFDAADILKSVFMNIFIFIIHNQYAVLFSGKKKNLI